MIDDTLLDCEERMTNSVEHAREELTTIRTGRANLRRTRCEGRKILQLHRRRHLLEPCYRRARDLQRKDP